MRETDETGRKSRREEKREVEGGRGEEDSEREGEYGEKGKGQEGKIDLFIHNNLSK